MEMSFLTRCLYAASMAICERSTLFRLDNTDQLCEIESIRHSSFSEEPRGVPSSNQARRYHSPSHAFLSMLSFSLAAACTHSSANATSFLKRAILLNCINVSSWKNPSQTLSPLPPCPTLSIPSFQSPEPINGRPCEP